jgi:peroxiredoxin Q/BCP
VEACDFRDNLNALTAKNTVVLGVSADSVKSHQNFKGKYELPFTLLADPDKELVEKYGVYVEKKNYGRTHMGVVSTTFVIDEAGKIEKVFNKVKVNGHIDEVLAPV